MPRGDKTGPLGEGPMTGRAAGYCAGQAAPGSANRVTFGRGGRGPGVGYGRGGGLGHRNRFYATGVPFSASEPSGPSIGHDEEISLLRQESQRLKSVMESIDTRLQQLENEDA